MFLYVLASLIAMTSSTWKIKVSNKTTLSIEPGVFYPLNIYLELTDEFTDQPYKALTNLSLSSEVLQTSEPFYELNSFLTLNYTVYIGVPCSSAESSHEVNFTLSNSDSFVFADPLKITVTSRSAPIAVSVQLLNTKISAGTFSMYYIYSPHLTNVDPITFTFANTTQSFSSVENKTMARYSQVTPRNFRGFFNASQETNLNQRYDISIDNKCYNLTNKTIEFSITTYKQKDISSYKTSIIKQFANFQRKDSEISFNLVIPISPTIVNCVAVTKTSEFPSGDAIRQGYLTEQSSPYEKYFNFFVRESQQNVAVTFRNLSTFRSYRIQCLVDDAVVNETERTSANITIGNFYKADIFVDTNPHPRMPFTTQCLTFQFGDVEGLDEFMPKMIDYCDNYFYRLGKKPSSMNGCVKCVERALPAEYTTDRGICIVSEEYCSTSYSGYMQYNVMNLKEMMRSTPDIQYYLGLKSLAELQKVVLEEDSFTHSEGYKNYIFGFPNTQENEGVSSSVNVVFKNNNTLNDFDCFVLDFDVTIPHTNLTREDFIGHSTEVFLPRKSASINNVNLTLRFKDEVFDNNIYPVIVKCFPLAFTDYRINESPTLLLNSFIRTNKTIPEDTQVPKKNCSDKSNALESECLNQKYYNVREFAAFNRDSLGMKPDTSALKENFLRLQYKFKKIKVIIEEEALRLNYKALSSSNFEQFLKQHVITTDLLKCCNCNEFPGYETCRVWKYQTMSNLTNTLANALNDTHNTSAFINSVRSLVNSQNKTEYYNSITLLYMAVYGLTTNPEAVQLQDLLLVHKLHDLLFSSYDALTQVESDVGAKNKENILYIMLSTSFNLIEISRFQSVYLSNGNNTDIKEPKFSSDPSLIEMYNKVNNISRMIIQQVSTASVSVIYNNNSVHLFKPSENKKETIFKIMNSHLRVEIGFNPFLLASSDPRIHYIGVTVYNVYPFLSEEDESTISHFVSITPFTNASAVDVEFIPKTDRPTIMFSSDYAETTPATEKYIKCIYIDSDHHGYVDMEKIESEIISADKTIVKCYLGRSGDVTIQRGYDGSTFKGWLIIAIIFVTVVVFVIALFVFAKKKAEQALRRKRVNLLDSGYKTIDSNDNSIEEGNGVNAHEHDNKSKSRSKSRNEDKKDKIKENIDAIKGYNIDDL